MATVMPRAATGADEHGTRARRASGTTWRGRGVRSFEQYAPRRAGKACGRGAATGTETAFLPGCSDTLPEGRTYETYTHSCGRRAGGHDHRRVRPTHCSRGVGPLLLQGHDVLGRRAVVPAGLTVPVQGRRLEVAGIGVHGIGIAPDRVPAVRPERHLVPDGRGELPERLAVPLRGRRVAGPRHCVPG